MKRQLHTNCRALNGQHPTAVHADGGVRRAQLAAYVTYPSPSTRRTLARRLPAVARCPNHGWLWGAREKFVPMLTTRKRIACTMSVLGSPTRRGVREPRRMRRW